VKAVFDGSDRAKIAAAAASAPKEVFVLRSVGSQEAAVGGNNIRTDDVVDGKAEFAVQVAPTAAKSQSGNTHCRNNALRCG